MAWLPSKKLVVVVDEGSDASNYRTQIVVVDLSRGLSNPASYRLDAPIGKLPRRGENPEMMRVTRAEGISADQVRLYVPESEYGVGSIVMDINP